MNVLKREKQIAVISMMVEGSSIRSIERVTGVHRDTIMKLMVRVGIHCATIMDRKMQGLRCAELQLDEIWTFVGKKERRCTDEDPEDFGDQYLYTSLDPITKLMPWFLVGRRESATTYQFTKVLASRVEGRVQISTDAYRPYVGAIGKSFAGRVDHGQVIKTYGRELIDERRYSPPTVIAVDRVWVRGTPNLGRIGTSHVERANWTIRGQMRRFTRLSNGFSRKLANLKAAVAIFATWYNFVRIHRSLGMTPAMAAQVTDQLWTVDDLIPSKSDAKSN